MIRRVSRTRSATAAKMTDDVRLRGWWGAHPVKEDSAGRWRIGPLNLFAHRRRHEWRIAVAQDEDPFDARIEVEVPFPPEDIPDLEDAARFGFTRSPDAIHFIPVLADRSVVLRPEHTLHIPPGESVSVFVSTPLWLRMSFNPNALQQSARGDESGMKLGGVLHEVPTFRPSDTWFGPTTLAGELCYASRTRAHVSVEDITPHPHRARTVVQVKNRAEDPLRLDRLSVPVRHLSLYASDDNSLWTERVTLTRERDGGLAALRVGEGAPPETRNAVKLTEARERMETNVVVRAFEAFFKEKDR